MAARLRSASSQPIEANLKLRAQHSCHSLAVLSLSLSLCNSLASAEEERKPASATIPLTDIQAAQLLMLSNHLAEAKLLLNRDIAANPDDREALRSEER